MRVGTLRVEVPPDNLASPAAAVEEAGGRQVVEGTCSL
jgi:hypothetical protein